MPRTLKGGHARACVACDAPSQRTIGDGKPEAEANDDRLGRGGMEQPAKDALRPRSSVASRPTDPAGLLSGTRQSRVARNSTNPAAQAIFFLLSITCRNFARSAPCWHGARNIDQRADAQTQNPTPTVCGELQ